MKKRALRWAAGAACLVSVVGCDSVPAPVNDALLNPAGEAIGGAILESGVAEPLNGAITPVNDIIGAAVTGDTDAIAEELSESAGEVIEAAGAVTGGELVPDGGAIEGMSESLASDPLPGS